MMPVGSERAKKRVFVITAQTDDTGRDVAFKPEDGIDTPLRVRPSIEIVAEEHDDIVWACLLSQLTQQVFERSQVTVDIADRERCHVPLSYLVDNAFTRR
jgi:hypothetical protein